MTSKLISKQTEIIYDTDKNNSNLWLWNLDIISARCKELICVWKTDLKEIHGAFQTEEGWRIRNNGQMQKLIRGEDRVKSIRAHSGGDISTGWEKQNSEEGYRMEFHRSEMQRMAKR